MMNNNILEMAKKVNSPAYIFDYDELRKRISKIEELSSKNLTLCYAIKANPFLIPALQNSGIFFEVCSPGELSICEKYKVSPRQIIFSGVCKTYQDVERAYLMEVDTITLESELHCEYLINVVKNNQNKNHQQKVIIRLTSGNQFGMSPECVEACIDKLKEIPSITIRGIHYFSGTQKKLKTITEEISYITDYCTQLEQSKNIKFENIEYGPGLSFNYFNLENEAENFSEYEAFVSLIKDNPYNFVIELGRYIASSCGSYITKIMDVKTNGGKNYCIIDGGINHINYYGQMMGMKVPPVEHITNHPAKTEEKSKYTICGSLCTTADIVLRELELQDANSGDLLIFNNIGAYSITEGIYLFLSHPLPEVYISENNKLTLVRKQIETFEINS